MAEAVSNTVLIPSQR